MYMYSLLCGDGIEEGARVLITCKYAGENYGREAVVVYRIFPSRLSYLDVYRLRIVSKSCESHADADSTSGVFDAPGGAGGSGAACGEAAEHLVVMTRNNFARAGNLLLTTLSPRPPPCT